MDIMDKLKLKELLARHTTTDMDKLEFARRISAEHLFQSIDECLNYIAKLMSFVSMNPDDPDGTTMDTFKDSPVLFINIMDEAICSLIYDIYHQMEDINQDFLAYIRTKIEALGDTLINTEYSGDYVYIRTQLHAVVMLLSFLATPVYHKEESIQSQLSYAYYQLMYTMYSLAKPSDEYFVTLANYYLEKMQGK